MLNYMYNDLVLFGEQITVASQTGNFTFTCMLSAYNTINSSGDEIAKRDLMI